MPFKISNLKWPDRDHHWVYYLYYLEHHTVPDSLTCVVSGRDMPWKFSTCSSSKWQTISHYLPLQCWNIFCINHTKILEIWNNHKCFCQLFPLHLNTGLMWWVYTRYNSFKYFSSGIDFRCQILMSPNVKLRCSQYWKGYPVLAVGWKMS